MKRGDLIVVEIGHDHRLCGVAVFHPLHMGRVNAHPRQSLQVVLPVAPHGGQWHRLGTELAQTIRNVAGTTAEFATQAGHKKGHIENVQLAGQYLLCEAPFIGHDGVERERAANKNGHEGFQIQG